MKMLPFLNRVYKPSSPEGTRSFFNWSGGSSVTPDSAMQISAFYSGVIYLSTQVAKLPWVVKTSDNKTDYDSPITRILNTRPNPEMSSFFFKLYMMQMALQKGNAYAEIVRNVYGQATAMYIIPTEDVQLERTVEGKLFYRIIGGSTKSEGDAILWPRDVFHIKNFHTKDGLLGQGIVAYAKEVLGISSGADKFANSLYANGGMPSGILQHPGALSKEAAKRLKESWSTAHGGRKVGGTAILEEGMEYKPVTYDPNVMQFLETRKFSVLEMARFLRVPPTKLYDGDSARFNNIEHANIEVAVDTIDAWARNFESEADIKLLSSNYGGKKTEMDIYAIFRGDMDTRSKYFSAMYGVGGLNSNEIRQKEGMAPYDGGDRYFVASNNFSPTDRIDEIIDAQIKSKENNSKEKTSIENDPEVKEAVVNILKNRAR